MKNVYFLAPVTFLYLQIKQVKVVSCCSIFILYYFKGLAVKWKIKNSWIIHETIEKIQILPSPLNVETHILLQRAPSLFHMSPKFYISAIHNSLMK